MKPEYRAFASEMDGILTADSIIDDPLRLLAYGTDASFYRLIPQLVLRPKTSAQISSILRKARQHNLPVTFRTAGTSLSGQAITDSILIQLAGNWQGYHIHDGAHAISLEPGVIGAQANKYLAPFQRKIGPDPASINAAMIGGIAANNSSGMCCGTAQNSYNTLKSMKVILADGTQLDTSDQESRDTFRHSHGSLLDALESLGHQARANTMLAERIRHKYRLKNTTGYALNALIDFTDPFDILQHLMIGSEGTLGFISEITYHTVEEHAHKASGLLFFAALDTTCQAVAALKTAPVAAVEMMDRPSLRSVQDKPGMPDYVRTLPDDAAALLVECRATSAEQLETQLQTVATILDQAGLSPIIPPSFSTDPKVTGQYWGIRKGMFPAVGAVRKTGTTVIIEDVAFPVLRLAEAVRDLHQLFDRWGYHEAIIFGHALEGNLHFVFTQGFDTTEEIQRYEGLMDDVARLVVDKYDGSLKAEHGTGRNMAPYVEKEWGADGYQLMWEIKELFDPDNLLNPGVLLNRDPQVHLQNLKPLPAADTLVDTCIECGFCEPTCPSRALTLTPRQRIVIWREIARLQRSGEDPQRLEALQQDYHYQGTGTCAACGLCSTACPVGINTGDLTRQIRSEQSQRLAPRGTWIANHFAAITTATRFTLATAHATHKVLGTAAMTRLTQGVRKLSHNSVGFWTPAMPTAAPKHHYSTQSTSDKPRVIYLPSCASRVMGPAEGSQETESLVVMTERLLQKAGFEVIYPEGLDSLCCGMPFQSKGLFEQADQKRREVNAALLKATDNGAWPIYCDTSPCSLRLGEQLDVRLQLHDPVTFIDSHVLDNLSITPVDEPVMLHITCSTVRQGLAERLVKIMKRCATEVVIPDDITCCGFAGDKGFSTPELNASALRALKRQVPANCQEGFSTSRTCEIGLSHHSGVDYKSIVYLLDRCSQATTEG
ncbi:4Fe-4S ferredoxin [Pokkaliibacter plantistimulans]|uniref:D-lactate dehydrogenase (cytochrome) n=1 Tax=Proteobacteria bacterium 228 TaxID=2083153 RepID=A0A2S5KTB5_9PROT|nr:FAD-binding and (Fe-S)-binding domain-containing protein [Pokkaliibacter plantistimulans]PPC77990.1 4Fe-4S ferredoxin [Pokkaliibacter plantistimulans]